MEWGKEGKAESTAVEMVRRGGGTEVEQRLCDVPRTLLSDPVGPRRAG